MKYTGKCTCNASDILEAIKDNEILRETIRGPPGLPGKEGKTGAPGLTPTANTPLCPCACSSVFASSGSTSSSSRQQ
ncbi:unnamed protein product [Ceratitis capitata]|uniref:(Mediterranean fruit fly) hypothetical protein n=1 Tax=Ceratitis capitata TaxID=7213 RepID=A0A811V0D4_CERCA|nr:unnamed protein product [Ceratitis capitata]